MLNFTEIRPGGTESLHAARWAERQTDMTKLKAACSSFANAPKKESSLTVSPFSICQRACLYVCVCVCVCVCVGVSTILTLILFDRFLWKSV